ncbi:unnamed protein product [Pylaiella littoralis]
MPDEQQQQRQQQQEWQRQRQEQRRSCFRSVPAHRTLGGGLGRRYDHAARLSSRRYAGDEVEEFDGRHNSYGRLPLGQQQQHQPRRLAVGLANEGGGLDSSVARAYGFPSVRRPPLPPPPPGLVLVQQQQRRRRQQRAPGIGLRSHEGEARAAGGLEAARDSGPPEQRQPRAEDHEREGLAGAAPAPLPPPRLAEASAVAEVPAAPRVGGRAPQQPLGLIVDDDNDNGYDNDSDRVPPPPPPPPPPGRESASPAGTGAGAAAALLRDSSRRRAGQAPEPAEPAAAGQRDARREACPPWGAGAGGSLGTGSRRQHQLPVSRRRGKTLTGERGGRVSFLSGLCLEAMVATWESHSASVFLPRAYHMPHELCTRLLRLLVSSKKLTASSLSGFLSPAALEVDLSDCSYVPKSVFKQIGFSCPRIIHLDLSMCSQVNNAIVRSVLQGCPALRQLYLDGCRHVTDAGFHLQQSPFYVLRGAVSLETISVQECPQVTGELVLHLRKVCRNLKELDLSRCKSVTSASVRRLFDSCPSLKSLNVSFLEGVVEEAFESLPAIDMAVFPAVIGDEAWDSTIPSSPSSRPLNLNNDSGGEAAVPAAAEGLLLQEGQRRRQRQNEGRILPWEGGGVEVEAEDDTLSSSRVVLRPAVLPSSPSITACSFSSLSLSASALSRSPSPSPSSSLPALRHINLGRCYGVTDRALARVAGAFPGLEGVRLEYCLRVTDVGVAALAAGCPRLKALGLRNCGQITNSALEALSVHCPSLEWLDLSWCGDVTDKGFVRLAEGCSGLAEVLAVWCEGITDVSLWALSRFCFSLEAVHVAGCEGVSAAAVAALRENGLEVLQ